MKRIQELKKVSTLITSYMKKGVLTNNYIMQEKYESYISDGRLYYEDSGAVLLFLLDCSSHWRIYYHIKESGSDIKLPTDKPIALEIVYKSADHILKEQLDFWEGKGFKQHIYRFRMNGRPDLMPILSHSSISVRYAQAEHAVKVHELIAQNFDRYLGCVPSQTETEGYIERQEILIAEDIAGSVQGVLHISRKAPAGFIWHLVVDSEFRGKGVARRLLAFFTQSLEASAYSKLQLWVRRDNPDARKLYEAAGLTYDGWESVGLLKL